MRVFFCCIFLVSPFTCAWAQSPYALSPIWYFGYNQGVKMTFPSGDFPLSTNPILSSAPEISNSHETSTGVCHPDGNIALYSDISSVFSKSNLNGTADRITNLVADGKCGSSVSGGGICFPNPAGNGYYLITGNDLTNGLCRLQGFTQYRYSYNGTGTSVFEAEGPLAINGASGNFVTEAITTATDGHGGYWLIGHTQEAKNTFRVWHYTENGISNFNDYTVGDPTPSSTNWSAIKISPCQDKIAFATSSVVTIHNFDRATGVISGELRRVVSSTPLGAYGLEFSPDGKIIYYCGRGALIRWCNIATGVTGAFPVPPGSFGVQEYNSNTIQLGPDGFIYTSPAANYIGKITSSNSSNPQIEKITIPAGSSYAGLTNISWLSPHAPVINEPIGSGCFRTIGFNFKNYFDTDVDINEQSVIWNFGDGTGDLEGLGISPQHNFMTSGLFNVTVTFKDSYCGQSWTTNRDIMINCSLPVELISFIGNATNGMIDLAWQTSIEKNNAFFEIQRSSDGINFEPVVRVSGKGNSNSVSHYNYSDINAPSGWIYYKLIQHDINNSQASSNTISVHLDKSSSLSISVSPNPFSSSFVLKKLYNEEASIIVFDMLGREIEHTLTTKEEKEIVLGKSFPDGHYMIKYINANKSIALKIEKRSQNY